jgi:hypothetical protein
MDHHRLHSCDRDRDAATGNESAGREASAQAGAGNAWVVGTGKRATAFDASLLNGTAGTWIELDEGNLFAKSHPGIQDARLPAIRGDGHDGGDLARPRNGRQSRKSAKKTAMHASMKLIRLKPAGVALQRGFTTIRRAVR